ncbi:hypothetical protein ACFL0G_01230 [Candidatus Zixiibacteriota bacterium]
MEHTTPEQPLLNLYQLISGPAKQDRPWDKIKDLFLPETRIRMELPEEDGSVRRLDWTVDDFAKEAAKHYSQDGFWEKEIARRTERYGNIAHVFSTYESRAGDPESDPIARGINSVQMLCREGRWLIAGIIFHMEQAGFPIPEKYL